MRLDINAGGLDSFFNGVSSFINADNSSANSNALIGSYQTVANKTSSISGGVGTLGTALGYIQACKASEEARKYAVQAVKAKTDNFISTAVQVDASVAEGVSISQEAFYQTNPWLRPPAPPSDWDRFWGSVADTAKACWEGVKDFYEEHKKVIDTILIVVGAVLAIAAVIATGGMALAPLLAAGLGALGVSAGTALTIATVTSLVVAGIAVTSTLASSTLNIIDTWGEIDNPAFNTWQSVLNWTSGISNGLYSIGSIFNSVKGISNSSLRSYSNAWIKDSGFRNAITAADGFNVKLDPNTSTFWASLGRDGSTVSQDYAASVGRSTLGPTLTDQGIPLPVNNEGWRAASASYAMRSSGEVSSLLGPELGNLIPGTTQRIGEIWLGTERILLNINPNVTSLTEIVNFGTAMQNVINIPRVFQFGSLFSGLSSGGESVISAVSD